MGILPFLKKDKESGGASSTEVVSRKPDEGPDDYDMLESAAADLKQAIESGDSSAIAAALRAAFQICQSEGDSYE